MNCFFQIKEAHLEHKTIVMGYFPSDFNNTTFVFSPISTSHKFQINYEVGTEEGVLILLAYFLCKEPSTRLQSIFDKIDIGYLSAETNIGEEELLELKDFIGNDRIDILLTSDFLSHPSNTNILAIFSEIALEKNISCLISNSHPIECGQLPENNGIVVRIMHGEPMLIGSQHFANFTKLTTNDRPTIAHKDFCIQVPFLIDQKMKGTIGLLYLPYLFKKYPYQHIQIK